MTDSPSSDGARPRWHAQIRWNKANPEKRRAHNKVANAIKAGRLEREPCAFCGSPDSEAHHHDYSKPLDIVWTCRLHHRRLHAGGARKAPVDFKRRPPAKKISRKAKLKSQTVQSGAKR